MRERLARLLGGRRIPALLPYVEGAGGILLLTAFFVYFYGRSSLLYPEFHPFLVVVLLVAGRYGFAPGLFAALFAILDDYLLFLWQNQGESLRPGSFSFLWPSAFLFTGMILGEMRDAGARKFRELEERFLKTEETARTAAFERDVLLKAKKELERRIFLEPNAVNDLFDVFRSLEKDEIESLSSSLLSLVVSYAGADRAALYRKDRRSFRLDLEAGSGASPRAIDLRYAPFSRAIETGEPVTLRSQGILPGVPLPEGGSLRPVGVYPVRGSEEEVEALLVVWHAPFEKLVPEFFQTLAMIVERASARLTFLRRQRETQEGVATDPETGFLRPVFFARRAAEELGKSLRYRTELSFLFVSFAVPSGEKADLPAALRTMRDVARAMLRDVDLAGLAPGRDGISLALPHTAPGGAAVVSEKLLSLWAEKAGASPLLAGTSLEIRRESFSPQAEGDLRDSCNRIIRLLDARTGFDPAARLWGEDGFRKVVERERREAVDPLLLIRIAFTSPSWEDALTLRRALGRVKGRGGGRLFPPEAPVGLSLDGRTLWCLLPGGTPELISYIKENVETLWENSDLPRLKQGAFLFDASLVAPGDGPPPELFAGTGQEESERPSPLSGRPASSSHLPEGPEGGGGTLPEAEEREDGSPGDLPGAVVALLSGRGAAGLTRRDLAKTSRRFARLSGEAQMALLESLVREGRLIREEISGRGRARVAYRHPGFAKESSDG